MTRSSVYWTILFCLLFHGLGIYFIAPLEIALPMLPYCIHICSSCALLFHGCILISSVGSWHLFWVFVVHMKLIHMYGRHGLILPWLGSLSFNVDLCNLLLHWYMRWFNILLFALGLNLSQALTYNILKTWWSLVCFFFGLHHCLTSGTFVVSVWHSFLTCCTNITWRTVHCCLCTLVLVVTLFFFLVRQFCCVLSVLVSPHLQQWSLSLVSPEL